MPSTRILTKNAPHVGDKKAPKGKTTIFCCVFAAMKLATLPEKLGSKLPHKTSPGGGTRQSWSSPNFTTAHFISKQHQIDQNATPFDQIPCLLQPLCHWLVVPSTTIPDLIVNPNTLPPMFQLTL
jgi:hypothetical protein